MAVRYFLCLVLFAVFFSVSSYQVDSMVSTNGRRSFYRSLHIPTKPASKYFAQNHYTNHAVLPRKKKAIGVLSLKVEKSTNDVTSTSSSTTGTSQGLNLKIEPVYLAAWLALLVFAFGFAPGEIGSQADNDLIMKLVNDPVGGGDVNRLWFAVWNFFAVVPATLACLLIPSVKKDQWLPAGPFVLSAAFLGYFTLGPYMYLRNSTKGSGSLELIPKKKGVVSSALENRFFGIFLALLACSIPFASGLVDAVGTTGVSSVLSDYINLYLSSRFVAVATTDLFILTVIASALIPEDLRVRRGGQEGKYDVAIAVSTLLLPAVGSALYIALRPSSIEEET